MPEEQRHAFWYEVPKYRLMYTLVDTHHAWRCEGGQIYTTIYRHMTSLLVASKVQGKMEIRV